ncbi:hypothetical protein D3C83_232920 [compost metagenome]
MIGEIGFGPPMPVPTGRDQHRLAPDIEAGKSVGVDRQTVLKWPPDDNAVEVRQRFQG